MSGMAILHANAVLVPTKMEMLGQWLPRQEWFLGSVDELEQVGSFRFVDPEGLVGMEVMIVTARESTYCVPLTYRQEPLIDGERCFMGNMDHSVLGQRWVYDAMGDHVFLHEIKRVIVERDTSAKTSVVPRHCGQARGSGVAEMASVKNSHVEICRRLDPEPSSQPEEYFGSLQAEWTEENLKRVGVAFYLKIDNT